MFRVLTIAVAVVYMVRAKVAPSGGDFGDITLIYDTQARIENDGYYSEVHRVTTRDGYILEINRIPYARGQNASDADPRRPVVFLMHGMQNSAVSYLLLGPKTSIAYNLADAGFDVWIGNARGVLNSRNHVILNPDDDEQKHEFFDYSFEEIATIDVPAMIDYILGETGREQLHYVGHSQGGTVFLVLNSLMPEYNEKFKSVHLLAPVGYQNHFPTRIIELLAQRTDGIYKYSTWRGYVEILGPTINAEITEACEVYSDQDACDLLAFEQFWKDLFEIIDVLAGSAIKQFAHYGQNIRDTAFKRWNYGTLGNLWHYMRVDPPAYNLNLITADVTMHYTVGDILLDERDVLAMTYVMPNARSRRLAKDSFSHTDFVFSDEVKELVTDYIIEEIKDNYKICEIVHN